MLQFLTNSPDPRKQVDTLLVVALNCYMYVNAALVIFLVKFEEVAKKICNIGKGLARLKIIKR